MKKHYLWAYSLFFSFFACFSLSAQINKDGYSLVYSSETPEAALASIDLSAEELQHCTGDFSSIENLERNWEYCAKAGSEWNERMGTTDEQRALVHKTENGHLRLLARTTNGAASGFITGGVRMKKGVKYGIIEVKAKCNPHASNFPAIWMMPVFNDGWPQCGEIDIMEMVGNSSIAHSTVHVAARYPNAQNGHSVGKSYSWTNNVRTSEGYHIYSLYWDKSSLIFYCDGKQVFRYNKDASLDLDAHPDYEKWQFPYNKEFELILNQSLGKNSGWGYEAPDPSFAYEMDVEYVRIWQAPATYEVDRYYLMKNYSDASRYMTVGADNKLTTTEVTSPDQLNLDMVFGIAPSDLHGKYHIVSYEGVPVATMPDANKAVPLSADDPCYFYQLSDNTKGVAFDYAKSTSPITYADGSRALTLTPKRNNVVTISGNSKDAAWWILEDATETIATLINEVEGSNLNVESSVYDLSGRKIVNAKSLNGKLPKGIYIRNGKKILVK